MELSTATLEGRILGEAKDHGGRYLLPRRVRTPKPWDELTELDLRYAACRLVDTGEARWLSRDSCYYPGIELTRQPTSWPREWTGPRPR